MAFTVMAASAHAQEASGHDEEARALFQAGQVAFDQGRYESALEYFRRSYELSHRPQLLYNVGAAADRLRLDADALAALERYLAEAPDAPNRAEVEARIAVLRRAVAAQAAQRSEGASASTEAGEEPEPAAPAPSEAVSGHGASDDGPDAAPWVVVGVGAAVAAAGAVMVGIAAMDVATVEGAEMGSSWSTVRDAYDRSEPLSIAGFVALGVGAAAAIGGVVWAAVAPSSGEEARTELVIGPGHVGVRGTF